MDRTDREGETPDEMERRIEDEHAHPPPGRLPEPVSEETVEQRTESARTMFHRARRDLNDLARDNLERSRRDRADLDGAILTAADRARTVQERVAESFEAEGVPHPPDIDDAVQRAEDLRDLAQDARDTRD